MQDWGTYRQSASVGGIQSWCGGYSYELKRDPNVVSGRLVFHVFMWHLLVVNRPSHQSKNIPNARTHDRYEEPFPPIQCLCIPIKCIVLVRQWCVQLPSFYILAILSPIINSRTQDHTSFVFYLSSLFSSLSSLFIKLTMHILSLPNMKFALWFRCRECWEGTLICGASGLCQRSRGDGTIAGMK